MKLHFKQTILFLTSLLSVSIVFSQGNTCGTATSITPGASCVYTNGTTVGATYQNNANNGGTPTCASPGAPDVWYTFTTTTAGVYTIDMNTGSITDSGMSLYSGACGSLTEVECDDDDSANGFMSMISTSLAASTTYYIRVWAYGGVNTGTFSICVTAPAPLPAGSIVMTNGSTSACSGTFYDPGALSNYGNSQSMVFTICPTIAGNKVRAVFSSFQTENSLDFLEIFDGNSVAAPSLGTYTGTTSPGTVQATPSNASGCLTFRFTSDGSVNYAGWVAAISCIAPCQTITSNLVSTNEAASGGIIRICQGQSVNFVGSGTFGTSGAGATYTWSMGNGATVNGTNINYTWPAVGSYLVNLTITDPSGCTNSNAINQQVQVSTTPTINTGAAPSTLCTNQTSALSANVTMNPFTVNCTPPVSGTTFLPDGSGVSYQTSITTNCYSAGATITAASDFQNVCLTMEHSYLGDLHIELICPNGQTMVLKAYADGGGGTYLGAAIDDVVSGPGTGSTYCFTPGAATLLVNGGTVMAGSPSWNSKAPGNYMPTQPFTNMIGCPLNGSWTIRVTDNLAADDGYIFNWDVNFNAALIAASSFTPTIASQGWVATPTLTTTGATTANVVPTNQGTPCFTYSVTDNFGCTYTAQQCITVNCGTSLPVGLTSFEANAVTNDRVQLNWTTSSEYNSDYFLLEKSVDGEVWQLLSEVDAVGNSQSELNYQSVDENPYFGTSYYRLKQYDMDGSLGMTDMEAVYLNGGGISELIVFPNPADHLVTLKGDLVSLTTFEVLNMFGQNVKTSLPTYDQGDGAIVLDISGLSGGVYSIRCGSKVIPLIVE